MRANTWIATLAIGLLAVGSGAVGFAQPQSGGVPEAELRRAPNILFLLADDQRADTIGAWGNRYIATENLNRLAARGFSFRNAYVFGSNSGAVCVPSRAMLHSGRYWTRAPNDLKGVSTLPERLGEAGYSTFITGKWHNEQEALLRSYQEGRSVYLGGMSNHARFEVQDLTDGQLSDGRETTTFSSELFADEAIGFLSAADRDQPFFAYVSFTAPHDPRQPPSKYRNFYYANLPPVPANFLPQHPFDNNNLILRDEALAAWPRSRSVVQQQLAEYYGMITHLDEQIGRVLAALEESPHAENTLVVFASDHGLALGSHGLLGKQSVYEHSVKAPLIVSGPGIKPGSSDALVYLHDLVPTLLSAAGLPLPAELDGKALQPLWTGATRRLRDSVFLPFKDDMRAIRLGQHKLIIYPRLGHRQLFDLSIDPDEMRDLAGTPENVDLVMKLTAKLRDWQTATGDTLPLESNTLMEPFRDLTGLPREPDAWQPKWIVKKYFGDLPKN